MSNKTGAKVAQKGAAFLLAFALGLNAAPMIASASVHPTNVQVVEDESRIKDQRERDVKAVSKFVANLDLETIRRAIELSDFLNPYDPEMYTYTDTTPGEVLNLDINAMYGSYQSALSNSDQMNGFINNGLYEKPALDAAIQFSTGNVSNVIKEKIASLFYNELQLDGLLVVSDLYVKNGELMIVAHTDNGAKVYSINGYAIPGIYETISDLDARYRMIKRNLRGDSNEYPNGLSFNGLERNTGESVWLSIGDSDIKDVINRGLDIARALYTDPTLSFECDNTNCVPLSEEELEFLSKKGIDVNSLQTFDKTYVYMTTELDQTLNMR